MQSATIGVIGMSETLKNGPDEEKLLDIGLRMQRGEEVSFHDQLRFLRYREKILSSCLTAGDTGAFDPLEHARMQIKAMNTKITNSGRLGGGTTGQATRDDAHRPEH
jgi:hypothetical protein